jgi:TRAP-type mannitol/chloroaromatic compound transport system permease small subunit
MSVNTPERTRRRRFKVLFVLSLVVSVMLQLWTGSGNTALFFVLPGVVFAVYMVFEIVRARRARRETGARRRPRVIYPLAFKVVGIPVFLAAVVMSVLVLTHKYQALTGKHPGLENTIEVAVIVAVLSVAQWQRTIIRDQLGTEWNRQVGLDDDGRSR